MNAEREFIWYIRIDLMIKQKSSQQPWIEIRKRQMGKYTYRTKIVTVLFIKWMKFLVKPTKNQIITMFEFWFFFLLLFLNLKLQLKQWNHALVFALAYTHKTQSSACQLSTSYRTDYSTQHTMQSHWEIATIIEIFIPFMLYILNTTDTEELQTPSIDTQDTHEKKIVVYSYTSGVISMNFSIQFSHAKWQNTVYMYLDWKLDREKKGWMKQEKTETMS